MFVYVKETKLLAFLRLMPPSFLKGINEIYEYSVVGNVEYGSVLSVLIIFTD